MSRINHRVTWFEIPTTDLTRAMTFYSTVLETDFHVEDFGGGTMAVFARETPESVSGCLVHSEHSKPSASGTVVYFTAGEDLAPALGRVVKAGGQIVVPKTLIKPEIGYFAVFSDTEGNTVGMFSPK